MGQCNANGTRVEIKKLVKRFAPRFQWTYGNLPAHGIDVIKKALSTTCIKNVQNSHDYQNKEKLSVRRLHILSGGFKVEGPEARLKRGPLMTSSYSANRDKHFWSSLRYSHRRICSWDYGMTDIAEGENAKGCSWYKTLKALKGGKTRLAKIRQ